MARSFDGTNDYATCPDRAGFDATSGTVSAWFRASSSGSGNRNILRRDDGGSGRHWLLRVTSSNTLEFLVIFGGNPSVATAATVHDDTWHHATGRWTFDNPDSTIELFYDGVSQGTATATGSMPTSAVEVNIGSRYSGGEKFQGDIAEAAMWNTNIGSGQIASLARGGSPLAVRQSSLVLYVPLLRENVDLCGVAPTLTVTSVSAHPRVIYPRRRTAHMAAAAAAASTIGFLRDNAGLGAAGAGPFARANAGLGAIA